MSEDMPVVRVPGDLFRIEFRPGDIFVLKTGTNLSASVANSIRDQWSTVMPGDVKLLILDKDFDLSIYRPVEPR